ncbi:proton-coupled amino acid transporter-like protein CG1139 [Achroia grisella]|uniref:proton-coupled amino acid transporter-like protein CG1139 n=1 Tax=Achroia grisella TaxID=688607 RepID=UPI0027D2AE78|nr:proton-coupled amino acid transporter-like protein CG1139 [Achroia grisella]
MVSWGSAEANLTCIHICPSEVFTQSQSTVALNNVIKNDGDDEYNPLEHRKIPHPTSTLGSFFHLLKSSLGSGLLAMPAAFKHTGLIPGCVGTMLVGIIATHCVHILVTTSRDLCREIRTPFLNYADTCERVFKQGPQKLRRYSLHIRHFVDYAMAGVCIGGTSVYVIFIAASLKDIVEHYAPEYKHSVEAYCGFLIIPLVIITQIRYLKFLVPFSIFANICLVVTVAITSYYTFSEVPNDVDYVLVNGVTKWPLFLSTAIFAMEGINIVMPIENEMRHPQLFLGCPGVLNITMTFVAILYGVTGAFGYLRYGNEVQGSVTLNLPQGDTLAMVAKFLIAAAVFFTYCLQMYAPMDIIWGRIQMKISRRFYNTGQFLLRTFSVLLTVILAVAIPDLELLIGLVGAIFFSTLGLLIPILVETVHRWERGLGAYSYILWKNLVVLILYLIVLISGCYSSISAMIEK